MKMTLTKNADMTSTTQALAKNKERQSKPKKDPDNEHRHDVEGQWFVWSFQSVLVYP